MYRILAVSDLHCGHQSALAPKRWNSVPHGGRDVMQARSDLSDWWFNITKNPRTVDMLLVCGDAIDGAGTRSAGTEQLTTDRNEQVAMAFDCLRHIKRKRTVLVYGTSYHTGDAEDYELLLSSWLNAEIYEHARIPIADGHILDARHHCNGGRKWHTLSNGTLEAAEDVRYNAVKRGDSQPTIVVRGHRHIYVKVVRPEFTAVGCPCMQLSSKYGTRRCMGPVDYGFLYIEIDKNGDRVYVDYQKYVPTVSMYG